MRRRLSRRRKHYRGGAEANIFQEMINCYQMLKLEKTEEEITLPMIIDRCPNVTMIKLVNAVKEIESLKTIGAEQNLGEELNRGPTEVLAEVMNITQQDAEMLKEASRQKSFDDILGQFKTLVNNFENTVTRNGGGGSELFWIGGTLLFASMIDWNLTYKYKKLVPNSLGMIFGQGKNVRRDANGEVIGYYDESKAPGNFDVYLKHWKENPPSTD
jgi:hypothetical protein